MSLTYPPLPPTVTGTQVQADEFLKRPELVRRRIVEIAKQRYISDRLLTRPLKAVGGSVLYESGKPITADEAPRAVAPGAGYPLVSLSQGTLSVAKTTKWGQDSPIFDESIARRGFAVVEEGMQLMVNENVVYIDSIALSAIASAVTQSTNATADWTTTATAAQIFKDVEMADANLRALNRGFDPDTVVVDDLNYAAAKAAFLAAGYFPREAVANNPALSGDAFMQIGGKLWLRTPNVPEANKAMVLDSRQLGGMADEELGGPGYGSAGENLKGVETKVIRDDDHDLYKLRVRRVTVPVILEPDAAWKIAAI